MLPLVGVKLVSCPNAVGNLCFDRFGAGVAPLETAGIRPLPSNFPLVSGQADPLSAASLRSMFIFGPLRTGTIVR